MKIGSIVLCIKQVDNNSLYNNDTINNNIQRINSKDLFHARLKFDICIFKDSLSHLMPQGGIKLLGTILSLQMSNPLESSASFLISCNNNSFK